MSDPQKAARDAAIRKKRQAAESTADTDLLNRLLNMDPVVQKTFKRLSIAFVIALVIFIGTTITMSIYFNMTIREMHVQYIRDTERVIITKTDIEASNSWEG